MDLVKVVLRIEFAEALEPWLDLRAMVRAISRNESAEIQGQPLTVDRIDQRQRTVVEVRALAVHQEGRLELTAGAPEVIAEVATIDEALRLPPMRLFRYDAYYIESYPLPFHELVARFKDTFTRPSQVSIPATDVGLLFDFEHQDGTYHLQFGPMEPIQLQTTYLIWPREQMPDQFLFVAAGFGREREEPFDRQELTRLLATASEWQLGQAGRIRDSLVGVGGV